MRSPREELLRGQRYVSGPSGYMMGRHAGFGGNTSFDGVVTGGLLRGRALDALMPLTLMMSLMKWLASTARILML